MEQSPNRDELFGKEPAITDGLLDKFKNNPGLPIGIAAFIGIGLFGAYNFKNRTMKPSLYLINLRVAAQGTVVVCLTATLLYKVISNEIYPKISGEKKN